VCVCHCNLQWTAEVWGQALGACWVSNGSQGSLLQGGVHTVSVRRPPTPLAALCVCVAGSSQEVCKQQLSPVCSPMVLREGVCVAVNCSGHHVGRV
jgi:hypothetical protein